MLRVSLVMRLVLWCFWAGGCLVCASTCALSWLPREPACFGFGQEEKRLHVLLVSRLPRSELVFMLSG